jgi:hypothetical protein
MCANLTSSKQARIINSTDLLSAMNKKYKGKWFDQFTFVQETHKIDENGREEEKSIWHEAIDYPKNFRIDYGSLSEGNSNVYANDSAWVFRANALKNVEYAPKEFLLMKGGLYHLTVKETINQLTNYGYDCSKFRTDELNDRKVFVIGAEKGDLTSKQFWLDAEHFYMVRRINTQKTKVVDVIYSNHISSNGGWVEQEVKFWVDEKYYQIEYYKQINTKPNLGAAVFNPNLYGEQEHWSATNK